MRHGFRRARVATCAWQGGEPRARRTPIHPPRASHEPHARTSRRLRRRSRDAEADAVPEADIDGELVVVPVFNDRSGGTWINVEGQEFLSPFLPDGLADGEAYLLDGTRLGPFRSV